MREWGGDKFGGTYGINRGTGSEGPREASWEASQILYFQGFMEETPRPGPQSLLNPAQAELLQNSESTEVAREVATKLATEAALMEL